MVLPFLGKIASVNPQAIQDATTIAEICKRNWNVFANGSNTDHYLSSLADQAASTLLRKFYAHFDMVIARSDAQQESLAEELEWPADKVFCLRPGTNVTRFHPDRANRQIWEDLGVPSEALIVLYVGRITPEKNVDFLHDVWTQFRLAHPTEDVRLVMVGHGEEKWVSRFRDLENTHVLGPRRGEELSRLYASSDLLVFPSSTETLGQVGLEAGSSGIQLIVSDRGGPKMYVEHDRTGWVLPTDDPRVWSDRIHRCALDRSLLKTMGARARDHICDNFTLDHTLESYWKLHANAIQLCSVITKPVVRTKVKPSYLSHLEDKIPRQGVMVISDFHAGKRCGNAAHRDQKKAAIRSMLSMAMEEKLEVIFGGDFGDHGARVTRLEDDFKAFRQVRDELGFGGRPTFVRGNHDHGYTDQRLEELTGGCRVHESLVYFHADAKVTICHGHIFGLAKTLEVIRRSENVDQILAQLHEDLLDEELKPAVIAYDIANMIETGLASHGLRGLSTAWEGAFKYRAMLAEKHSQAGRRFAANRRSDVEDDCRFGWHP